MKNDEHVENQRLALGFPQQLSEDARRYVETKAPDFHLGEVNLSNSSIHGHILSDEALHQFRLELDKGNEWLAYNSFSYTLEKYDLYFFGSQEEANDFADANVSDFDNYCVINCRRLPAAVAENITDENMSFIQNTNTMNQKNFDYLKDQVKFTGFGEALENELGEKMHKQAPEFQLYHNTKFGNDVATATLHFKKSDQSAK